MISMHYSIPFPTNYDMSHIRNRVAENGAKTDFFDGLEMKAYLMCEKNRFGNSHNGYAPLYLWNDPDGMNTFLFQGYYDQIVTSFGWQSVAVSIPYDVQIPADMPHHLYIVHNGGKLKPSASLRNPSLPSAKTNELGKVVLYNPTSWRYDCYEFMKEKPSEQGVPGRTVYEMLHLSRGASK
ncbi:hypothetical protein A374_18119 [Fictibacillus macauensis ZFHKF-1]|uniref:Petrobactin biosynthesis protein AsbA n=1 Tax=Fictibacillus macauensis ZFHKF-1 TaxID=1196324 RepID=I8AEI2_9BACL|nr:DUF4865 family protein [Fictibacillus macauensis]EIT83977.1 hypothetical protein A374_18119 [Fictibacillus macauensis ZFHKF-1]